MSATLTPRVGYGVAKLWVIDVIIRKTAQIHNARWIKRSWK